MPLLGDRYELGARLGSGGMADVYEAYDVRLARRVAVKILRTDLADPTRRARFAGEGRALAMVAHPSAVTVYDVGEDDDRSYIVMELVDGTTLASQIARRYPFTAAEVRRVADQILSALEVLHARGMVHRDIKPANVLIAGDGRVKLTDFGIAKAFTDATPDLTLTGQVLGTVRYLAPEVAAGQPATPQSDLYAVGVVVDEMLIASQAGGCPEADVPTRSGEIWSEPTMPFAFTPQSLAAVTDKARQPDPMNRFASAHDMRVALNQAADAPTARMDTAPYNLDRTETRQPHEQRAGNRRVILVFLAALLLAGAAAVLASYATRARPPKTVARVASSPTSTPRARSTATAPSTAPVATSPARVVGTQPRTLQQLVALLNSQPDAYGSRAHDLRDRLQQMLNGPPGPARKNTTRLVADINKWASQGELDPAIAATATRLLDAEPRPEHHDKKG